MRRFLAIFVFFLLSCGGHTPPPPPPVPPPPPTCNPAAFCGEPNACPDCKPKPPEPPLPPPPPPPPPPTPVCDQNEPLDLDCAPIVRDHSQHIILGNYVGCTMQKAFDWEAYFKLLNTTHFNGSSHHVISPWNADDGYGPWKFAGGKFLLKQWNPEWWNQFDEMLKAAAYYDDEIELCLIDQYAGTKWQKYGAITKYSPWRTNDQKNICGNDDSCRDLYRNWNKQNIAVKSNFALFGWTNENDPATFRAVNGTGQAFMDYVREVAKHCATIRDWAKANKRTLRLMIRTANEPGGITGPDDRTIDYGKSFYLDDRTDDFVFTEFKKQGFKSSDTFKPVYEWEIQTQARIPNLYWLDKAMRGYIVPRRAVFEHHNLGTVAQLKVFLQSPLNWNQRQGFFMASCDGKKETGAQYYRDLKEIAKLKLAYYDYKLQGDFDGKWSRHDMNENVKRYVPMQETGVFGK